MAVIIPKEILEETEAREGDVLKISLPIPKSKRKKILKKIAGIDSGTEPFVREKRERL